jgi:hypothetical protein
VRELDEERSCTTESRARGVPLGERLRGRAMRRAARRVKRGGVPLGERRWSRPLAIGGAMSEAPLRRHQLFHRYALRRATTTPAPRRDCASRAQKSTARRASVVAPAGDRRSDERGAFCEGISYFIGAPCEERRRRQLPSATARAKHKRERAIRRGNPDRPWGCWEVAVRSLARGGYAARTDFPRSLAMAWRSI